MKKIKKLLNGIMLVLLAFAATGARSLPVETTKTDAPFRIKKVYEPKRRSPASVEESLPKKEPAKTEPGKEDADKNQLPWRILFSRKSTR